MMRFALPFLGMILVTAPALAAEFDELASGQIDFTMPSGNIGCIYTPEGGTDNYEPESEGPELTCDRIDPTYVRITLGGEEAATRLDDVKDASCCGAENTFDYGDTWEFDGFTCVSATDGLKCSREDHGFFLSRARVETW